MLTEKKLNNIMHASLQAVVVLIGTNNHGCSAEQISDGIVAVVDAIRERQKTANIIVLVSIVFT